MEKKELSTEIEKVSYSLGVNVAKYYQSQGLKELDQAAFSLALTHVYGGDSVLMSDEQANQVLQAYFTGLRDKEAEKAKAAGVEFLAANAKKEGVVTLPSGLQYQVITEGTGAIPTLNDKVKTHYHGTLIDGTVFDSSVQRGEPISFPVSGVIKGWTEALQLMKVGSKWRLFVPSDMAYGERGAGQQIPPHSALIFEVELLDIEKQ